MPDINLELPFRLKPHLRMDAETGEVVARLSPEAVEQIRQIVREEIRQALPLHKMSLSTPLGSLSYRQINTNVKLSDGIARARKREYVRPKEDA